jgi:beta-N-acetylhexosaminidase
MTAAVAAGRVTPERLAQSVRRVLEIKRRLGLLERRTVPLDSIPPVVGSRRFQDAANDVAVRSLTLVRDVGGRLHALRAHRGRLALIAYADEANSGVGQFLTDLLRQGGDTVEYFRLWPMSGTLSYDSARAAIARAPATVFVANVRPLSAKGTIALPDSLAQLITVTDAARPSVLVSLGSPYLLNQTPTVRSYVIAWSGVRASERAVALALLGRVPIGGRLPIRLPPDYPLGWGVMVPAAQP